MTERLVADRITEAAILTMAVDERMDLERVREYIGFSHVPGKEPIAIAHIYEDRSVAHYESIKQIYDNKTAVQAGVYKKRTKKDGVRNEDTIVLVFPGTARVNHFTDKSVREVIAYNHIGNRTRKIKEWLDKEVLPDLPKDQPIEITAHSMGCQTAIWAKAYLQNEGWNVTDITLVEPVTPSTVLKLSAEGLAEKNGTTPLEEGRKIIDNMVSVYSDPLTIIAPLGLATSWDIAPIGDKAYILDVNLAHEGNKTKGLKTKLFRNHHMPYIVKAIANGADKTIVELPEPDLEASLKGKLPKGKWQSAVGLEMTKIALATFITLMRDAAGAAKDGVFGSHADKLLDAPEDETNRER